VVFVKVVLMPMIVALGVENLAQSLNRRDFLIRIIPLI